jgi:hypothetical protein
MPNPEAAKKLSEYGCQIKYKRDTLIKPRPIKDPDDIRPGTKKGKLDESPIWVVEVTMPKKLILDVFRGYRNELDAELEPANNQTAPVIVGQPAEQAAAEGTGEENAA